MSVGKTMNTAVMGSYSSCPILRKMAARFPELWESSLISQQDPQKQQEYKEGNKNFPDVFRQYLKERELDEDQLVSAKAKLCFSSVFLARKHTAPSSNDKTVIEFGSCKIL